MFSHTDLRVFDTSPLEIPIRQLSRLNTKISGSWAKELRKIIVVPVLILPDVFETFLELYVWVQICWIRQAFLSNADIKIYLATLQRCLEESTSCSTATAGEMQYRKITSQEVTGSWIAHRQTNSEEWSQDLQRVRESLGILPK